jgi:diaminopimelate epimerase
MRESLRCSLGFKMKIMKFTKMAASGNDFVVIDDRLSRIKSSKLSALANRICDRKFGIGADGLLLLEKSKLADVKMRIFNADGSEAEMCGNGARCVALFSSRARKSPQVNIETKAGIIKSEIKGENVRIRLTDPKNMESDIAIKVNNRNLRVNFIDTGVPHAVIFVEGLKNLNVNDIGRTIRFHKKFSPRGTNVDFVQVEGKYIIEIRTYERGVEDETLACGTGSVAAALFFALKTNTTGKINVKTKSGEMLRVYFKKTSKSFRDVWLEGKAGIVYKGDYYV